LGRRSRIDANSGLPVSGRSTPHPAIGGRASAVVVMVESKKIVMLTAVAGHRLPHCWRDDDEPAVRLLQVMNRPRLTRAGLQ
jgi:hypothetical protein